MSGSGCGAVDGAVASDIKGPWFGIIQKIYLCGKGEQIE